MRAHSICASNFISYLLSHSHNECQKNPILRHELEAFFLFNQYQLRARTAEPRARLVMPQRALAFRSHQAPLENFVAYWKQDYCEDHALEELYIYFWIHQGRVC